jgi:hypothetical protein
VEWRLRRNEKRETIECVTPNGDLQLLVYSSGDLKRITNF